MTVLVLMGVSTEGGWLELVLPVWIIVAVAYIINYVVRFVKKKLNQKSQGPVNDLTAPINNPDQDQI